MTTALELLKAYLDNIQDPAAAAALFAEDGILELPTIQARAVGPAQIQGLVAGLLAQVPDFRFKDLQVWIDTPDKVFAEYSVEAVVVATGKVYRQTYAGVLIAEHGKIKRLREALDTAAAAAAFKRD
jgi:ketosteroid isomerase-like protein